MSRTRPALGWLACPMLILAVPATPAAHETVLGAEYGVETLDISAPNWRGTLLSATHTGDEGSLRGEWREVERFGVHDSQWTLSGGARGHGLVLTIDFSGSADHEILPEFSAGVDLAAPFAGNLVAHLGARRATYTEEKTTALQGGLELYRGDWRLAYSLINGRIESGDSGTAHVGQFDSYYGDGSRIGLIAALGGEATRIDPSTVVVADVRSVALVGRHWLDPAWGLTYVWSRTEQGDFYTRQGIALGFLFRF